MIDNQHTEQRTRRDRWFGLFCGAGLAVIMGVTLTTMASAQAGGPASAAIQLALRSFLGQSHSATGSAWSGVNTFTQQVGTPLTPIATANVTAVGNATNGTHVFKAVGYTRTGHSSPSPVSLAATVDAAHKTTLVQVDWSVAAGFAVSMELCASKANTTTPLYAVPGSNVPSSYAQAFTFNTADASLVTLCATANTTADSLLNVSSSYVLIGNNNSYDLTQQLSNTYIINDADGSPYHLAFINTVAGLGGIGGFYVDTGGSMWQCVANETSCLGYDVGSGKWSVDARFDMPMTALTAVAFADLPGSPAEGMIVAVNNANTAVWGATISGTGANHVLAYYDGTNWTVMGK